jgi:hypothetical protein
MNMGIRYLQILTGKSTQCLERTPRKVGVRQRNEMKIELGRLRSQLGNDGNEKLRQMDRIRLKGDALPFGVWARAGQQTHKIQQGLDGEPTRWHDLIRVHAFT